MAFALFVAVVALAGAAALLTLLLIPHTSKGENNMLDPKESKPSPNGVNPQQMDGLMSMNNIDTAILQLLVNQQPVSARQMPQQSILPLIVDRWRIKCLMDHVRRLTELDEVEAQRQEHIYKRIAQLLADGMVSKPMRAYLEAIFGGPFKLAQHKEEISDLKHALECEKIRTEMTKLRQEQTPKPQPAPETVEQKYRQEFDQKAGQIIARLKGLFGMKRAIFDQITKIRNEVEQDISITLEEKEKLLDILAQEASVALLKANQEKSYGPQK